MMCEAVANGFKEILLNDSITKENKDGGLENVT